MTIIKYPCFITSPSLFLWFSCWNLSAQSTAAASQRPELFFLTVAMLFKQREIQPWMFIHLPDSLFIPSGLWLSGHPGFPCGSHMYLAQCKLDMQNLNQNFVLSVFPYIKKIKQVLVTKVKDDFMWSLHFGYYSSSFVNLQVLLQFFSMLLALWDYL